jgi:hypothetical protein
MMVVEKAARYLVEIMSVKGGAAHPDIYQVLLQ